MSSSRCEEIRNSLPAGVKLLAVSKGQPITSIRELALLGQNDFGESRLQEALPKLDALKEFDQIRWHFIGRLQSNKVRMVVRNFHVIHSIDSFVLAERLSRISREENKFPKIMLQVKFRDDPKKGGFFPDQLMNDWHKIKVLKNIDLVGLMTIAPLNLDLIERKALFSDCRSFADSLGLPDCSMGMSSDWKEAVKAGSTWLRVGSELFGPRPNLHQC